METSRALQCMLSMRNQMGPDQSFMRQPGVQRTATYKLASHRSKAMAITPSTMDGIRRHWGFFEFGVICTAGTEVVWRVLRTLHGLRNEMAHLCTNLQAYLMFEVLERAWTHFTARLAKASDLDSLIGTTLASSCSACMQQCSH